MKVSTTFNVTLSKNISEEELSMILDRHCSSTDEYKDALLKFFQSQKFSLESEIFDITGAETINLDLHCLEVEE